MCFFNDAATSEIYTLTLHDALPICRTRRGQAGAERRAGQDPIRAGGGATDTGGGGQRPRRGGCVRRLAVPRPADPLRSEEHTSELQSRQHIVCRLLLDKDKPAKIYF